MLKYSAICFYHWKQLYDHVMVEKARKAEAFLKLALRAVSRSIKRDAFARLLRAKTVKKNRRQTRKQAKPAEKDEKNVLPS